MTAKKPTPAITGKKPRATKVPRADQYAEWGARIRRIEKDLDGLRIKLRDELREIQLKRLGGFLPDDALIDDIQACMFDRLLRRAIDEIREYVKHDGTEPIPVKYLGRSLRDIGAVDEPTSKTRVEVFASFHDGPGGDYLATLTSPKVDYCKCAMECHQYEASRKAGMKTSRGKFVTSRTRASQALEKPVVRLEDLALAESVLSPDTAKRESTFLRRIGQPVFEGWPAWPGETPSGPST